MSSTMVGKALSSDGSWFDGADVGILEPRHLRPHQPSPLPIDTDHDGRQVGQILHLALDHAGNLWVVGVLDEPPDPDRYLSVTARHRDGENIEVRSVSLTAKPAAIGLTPVRVFWGIDARRSVAGLPWGTSDHHASLLADAHRAHRRRLDHLEVAGLAPAPPAPPASTRWTRSSCPPREGPTRWVTERRTARPNDLPDSGRQDRVIEFSTPVRGSILGVR